MKTNNPKIIGITMLLVVFGILGFWGFGLFKMATYPFTGTTREAKVIGYKVSSYGAKMITTNRKLSGRSPFFEFVSTENKTIKGYSKSPQIFVLFNYKIGEDVTVAYPTNKPNDAIIASWKELPGLFLMIGIGLLSAVVGKNYLFKK